MEFSLPAEMLAERWPLEAARRTTTTLES